MMKATKAKKNSLVANSPVIKKIDCRVLFLHLVRMNIKILTKGNYQEYNDNQILLLIKRKREGIMMIDMVIGIVIAAAAAAVIIKKAKDAKAGKSGCGCGCAGCTAKSKCHNE